MKKFKKKNDLLLLFYRLIIIPDMSFRFTQEQVNTFYKFVVESDKLEFEVRFGKFDNKRFISNLQINVFYRIKTFLEKSKLKYQFISTKEDIYGEKENAFKHVFNLETKTESLSKKSRIDIMDISNYNMRFALSKEEIIKKLPLNLNFSQTRNKIRHSYISTDYRIDLTIVDGKYECELEAIPSATDKSIKYKEITKILTTLNQVINDSFYIIGNDEKEHVIKTYSNLIKKTYFIAAQPETLHKDELHLLYDKATPYSVTEKLDGERALMVIDNFNTVYLLDNNFDNIKNTELKTNKYPLSVLDGELLLHNGKFIYFIFDILVFDGQDIRGLTKYNLSKRLNLMHDIQMSIQFDTNSRFVIHVKEYIFKDVFLGSEIILNRKSLYKNDGLIFTPINDPYPTTKKWKNLLKWKPSNQNSIDFYSVKKTGYWELYVQVKNGNDRNKKELFNVEKLCFNIPEISKSVDTFTTEFPDSLLDPLIKEPYRTNTVIEYIWDSNVNFFIPIRTRWDKTLNPQKHGNFSGVACDIWKNIHNPITKELLFKTVVYNDNDFYFKNMRFFHNRVKETLYDTYTRDTNYLLELSSGKGGDLNKWVKNNIKVVNGYDISKKNIQECVSRYKELLKKTNKHIDYHFFQQDLTDLNSPIVIASQLLNDNLYDNVFCNFAIHYYFEKQESLDNIIHILDVSLKNKGHFVVTFMDSKQVSKLLKDKDSIYKTDNNQVVYYLKTSKSNNKNALFNNKLRIVLNGNNILNEGSSEYIIDFELFTKYMENKGYILHDSKLFSDIQTNVVLDKFERDISYLNRYCVFYKNKDLQLTVLQNTITPETTMYKKVNNLFNLKNNSDLTIHRVTDYKDIFNVVQSIAYKYKTDSFINKEIITFSDIASFFNTLNKSTDWSDNTSDIIPFDLQNPTSVFNHYDYINFLYNSHKIDIVDNPEPIFQNSWYIVLYKQQIISNPNDILHELNKIPNVTPQSIPETDTSKISESVPENVTETDTSKISESVPENVTETDTSKISESVSETDTSKISESVSESVPKSVPETDTSKISESLSQISISENKSESVNDDKKESRRIIRNKLKENTKITVADLKTYLKELNLPINGLKAELSKRLLENLKKK
jgi:hypothetical protein